MGYQRNKYYWCVMRKNVKDKKCTIIWHVDEMKMPHVDYDIVSSVITDIGAEYVKICENEHHAG